MMDTVIFLHAGGGIAMTMAGVGALKFFFSASESVKRLPDALERSATAQEKQAELAEQASNLAAELRDIRAEIREEHTHTARMLRIVGRRLGANLDDESQN